MKKILMISAVVASVFAAEYQVGAGFGRNGVSNSPIKNYNYGNIRMGKYLPKNHILRVELERSTSIKTNNNISLSRLLLNVEHYFNTDTKFTPYAFIGGGYQWVKSAYDNAAVVDLGIGVRYQITKVFNLFAEAKGMRDFHNDDNHFGFLGGIEFNFGGKTEPAQANPVKKVVDTDKDGVPDNLDKCQNTPVGVKVDKNGCAIDSDNDGVSDYLDKCQNTPVGVKVNKNGCAIDSDNDGVADYLDKCPNTPKGMKVDKNGCAVSFDFGITFDNNSAKIKPQFMSKIKKFADFLKAHPNIKAEIQGYTDNKGNFKYNLLLSQKRAKAVYEALIKLGVNKNQLNWAGFGPKNPIASNTTKEGKAQNRRVVAKISY